MITEAGMIGKVGLNSAGVGVNYNALNISGLNDQGLPSHLALRMALESRSPAEACRTLEAQGGMAASAYIMVGNATEACGIEFSFRDMKIQQLNAGGSLYHTNHCVLSHHPDVVEQNPLPDSFSRIQRMSEMLDCFHGSEEEFSKLWEDEDNYPTSICRDYMEGKSRGETLFNIVTNLNRKTATVRVGRPISPDEVFIMGFED
jgi:isopenicillin-N N-acyltransferase